MGLEPPPELATLTCALGHQLAAARQAAEIGQQQVAHKTGYSRSSVAHAEAGRQLLSRDFWKTADELVKADGALLAGYERVQAAKQAHETQRRKAELAAAQARAEALSPPAVRSSTTALPPDSYPAMSPWGVVSEPNPADVEPIDEEFIAAIRSWMQELLALDALVGGNETSVQALRLFRSVHRRIGVSPFPKRLQRDVYAAVGELAEIAGWCLYDADQQDAMRRINQEALYYLRWAGHRSLELLTLQNMSMQAEYLNRPSEALHIVHSVLETDQLSPRIESLFLARGAHALAQQHQETEAVRTFRKAQTRYLDGPRDTDPSWAYWVDEGQFAWFEAMIWKELGERDKPAAFFAEALAACPQHHVRMLYNDSVYLFDSLVDAGDWREAEQLIPKLAPYIGEVGSGRTASILRKTLHTVQKTATTPTLADGAMWLRRVLEGSPVGHQR